MHQQEILELLNLLVKKVNIYESKLNELESKIVVLSGYFKEVDKISSWITFKNGPEYSKVMETLLDMNFSKKDISRMLYINYEKDIDTDKLIKAVMLQLSTKNIFRE